MGASEFERATGRGIIADWPRYVGRRRSGRDLQQRSIRSTITVLLVLPLLSLIGLWAYAAKGTVGGAMAERDATIVNTDIGAPLEGLIEQLAVERADTFVWQSADGHLPRGSMVAQRPRTDAAIAAFRAGATAASGVEPLAVRLVAAELLRELSQIGTLRAEVDARTISPLAAFQAYNTMVNGTYPFVGALSNPEAPIQNLVAVTAAAPRGRVTDMGLLRQVLNGLRSL
jgi:hypothetical protein